MFLCFAQNHIEVAWAWVSVGKNEIEPVDAKQMFQEGCCVFYWKLRETIYTSSVHHAMYVRRINSHYWWFAILKLARSLSGSGRRIIIIYLTWRPLDLLTPTTLIPTYLLLARIRSSLYMWCRPGQTNLLLPSHLSSFRLSRKSPIIAITQTITLIPHSQHWRLAHQYWIRCKNSQPWLVCGTSGFLYSACSLFPLWHVD